MIAINKRVEDLQPYLQYLYKRLVEECGKAGMTLCLIETKRSQERQTELFKQGAGPQLVGPHGAGLAFDVAPIKNGKVDWGDYSLFKKMGQIGKSLGLEWGGDWKNVDCPHFQFVGGLTDAQIRAGKLPVFPPIPKEKEEFDIMGVKLQPVCKGELWNCGSLECCEKPSNGAKRNGKLVKGIHEPINIYAKTYAEGIYWYLINPTVEQWIAAHYVKII